MGEIRAFFQKFLCPRNTVVDQIMSTEQYQCIYQSRYHAIQNGGAEVVQFGNFYITHGIVGYTETIDLLCKSANLVSVPRGDRIKLWS